MAPMAPMAPMTPRYTPYHPRWHRRRMPIFWWLGKASYMRFIVRELTSLAVAATAIELLVLMVVLDRGEAAFSRYLAWLARPGVLALHGVVLAGLLFHTVTWLNLAPKALVIDIGGRRLPDRVVAGAHYLAWAAASAAVVAYLLRG